MNKKDETLQRNKARLARALGRREDTTIDEAATKHGLSRAHYYRIVEALEAWEAEVTRAEELAELDALIDSWKDCKTPGFWAYPNGFKFALCSGYLYKDVIDGKYDDMLNPPNLLT